MLTVKQWIINIWFIWVYNGAFFAIKSFALAYDLGSSFDCLQANNWPHILLHPRNFILDLWLCVRGEWASLSFEMQSILSGITCACEYAEVKICQTNFIFSKFFSRALHIFSLSCFRTNHFSFIEKPLDFISSMNLVVLHLFGLRKLKSQRYEFLGRDKIFLHE